MNEIVKLYKDHPVRIVDRDGEPWFVAKDVCEALTISNPRKAVTQLDDDEHMTVTFGDGRPGHGAQKINIISESGLYALVIRSNKPGAREFRKWVTAEVLPSIRKTGAYVAPNLGLEALGKLVLAIKKQYEFLVEENAMLRQKWEYAMQFLPKTGYGTKSKANGQRKTTIRRGANVAGNGRLIQFRDPDEVGYRSQMDLFGEYLPRMIFADAVNIINIHCPKLLEGTANV